MACVTLKRCCECAALQPQSRFPSFLLSFEQFKVQPLTTMAKRVLRVTRQFQFTRKAALNRSHVSLLVFSARFTPLTVGGGSFCCQREDHAIHNQRPQPGLWPGLQHHTQCQCQELHGPVWRRLWSDGAVLHLQRVFPPCRDQPTLQKRFEPQLLSFSVAQQKQLTSTFCSSRAPPDCA